MKTRCCRHDGQRPILHTVLVFVLKNNEGKKGVSVQERFQVYANPITQDLEISTTTLARSRSEKKRKGRLLRKVYVMLRIFYR